MKSSSVKKGTRIKIGSILCISFLLLYVPSLIHWGYGNNIGTQLIRMGTIEDVISADGVIVRDEELLKSPFAGKCLLEVNEGDKVPVGYQIATVLKESSYHLLEELRSKDNIILKNQMEKSKNQEIFSADIVKIEDEISQKVRQVIDEKNNLYKVKQLKDEIDALIRKKAQIFGSSSTADTYINTLKKEKERIQYEINQNKKDIYTNSSGCISFTVDGYEEELTPQIISKLTPKKIDDIKINDAAQTAVSKNVEVNKPFAKVIKSIDAFIVITLDQQKGERFKVDDTIDEVRINQMGYTTSGKVDYKSSLEDGKYIVSIKIDKGISETTGLRKVNVDLVKNSYKGLKVHIRSLRDIDWQNMTAKICLVKFNYSKFADVRITGYNEDFAIIDNIKVNDNNGISLYDTYIVEPENIQEGQMINK